jgi:hypothetical protein
LIGKTTQVISEGFGYLQNEEKEGMR